MTEHIHTFGNAVDLSEWKKEVDKVPEVPMYRDKALAIARSAIAYQLHALQMEKGENTAIYQATKDTFDRMLKDYEDALKFLEEME